MMATWYFPSIAALICMGTQRFLYKVSAERKCNTAWTTFSFMGTVALLSAFSFVVTGEPSGDIKFLLFVSFVNSGTFLLGTVCHIEALKRMPTAVVYPLIRLNVVIVVIFSIFYFKDILSVYQAAGIMIAIAVIVILTRQSEEMPSKERNARHGFMFVIVSLFAGSLASISSKFAAVYTNLFAFMAVSYTISTLLAFGLRDKLQTEAAVENHKDAIIIGLVMGMINFAGFYSFLKALSAGPLSIIAPIIGMHFVIAIILSALIYKEKLTTWRMVGILLTIVSIILLRLKHD